MKEFTSRQLRMPFLGKTRSYHPTRPPSEKKGMDVRAILVIRSAQIFSYIRQRVSSRPPQKADYPGGKQRKKYMPKKGKKRRIGSCVDGPGDRETSKFRYVWG